MNRNTVWEWGVVGSVLMVVFPGLASAEESLAGFPADPNLLAELKTYPYRIVYETCRDNNWELFMMNADGSNSINLTRTPGISEVYPHVSPDGTKICFVADLREGTATVRHAYTMNLDGSGRTLVARNGRDPCWNHDGSGIYYLGAEGTEPSSKDYAAKGLVYFDLKTGRAKEHPNNKQLSHLYAICCTPDGQWILSSVHGGMGFSHAILAIQAAGMGVVDLRLVGCRPDVRWDGKMVANGSTDFSLTLSDLDVTGPEPRALRQRAFLTSGKPNWVYHVDWSPDGGYVAFSRGPKPQTKSLVRPAPESVGSQAPGWNICVADALRKNRWAAITTDGNSNKEPDWVPRPKSP